MKIKYFSHDEIETIRITIADWHIKYKIVVEILLQTGMRVGELISLKWTDVNFDEQIITVKTLKQKSNAFRSINIPLDLTNKLQQWYDHKDSIPGQVVHYSSTRGVRNLCDKIQDLTNIEVYPHKFRHTYAVHSVRAHKNLRYLQKQGGWSSLQNVQIYLQFMEYDEEKAKLEGVFK